MTNPGSTLRLSLSATRPVVATFVMVPRVEVIEMLAIAGFDAAILDLEHGPIGVADLPELAAFVRSAGIHSIARIPELNPSAIAMVLDAGFDGVMVPHMGSAERALSTVSAARFPPHGVRSLNPYVRGASYDASTPDGLARFNDHPAVVGMLEGRHAISELDRIVATPGLDGLFVGPIDLSGDLGHPGQPEHPEVVEVISHVFEVCAKSGVASGVYAPTPERADFWLEAGASLVAVSADSAMMLSAFSSARAQVTSGFGGRASPAET